MLEFEPRQLKALAEMMQLQIPLAQDYALRPQQEGQNALEALRGENIPFSAMAQWQLQVCYQMADACTPEEFTALRQTVMERANAELFTIGWQYCQLHESPRAVVLFSAACAWMARHQSEEYSKTLVGITGLPWEDIFFRSAEMLQAQKISLEEFCQKYEIITGSPFYNNLALSYIARCDTAELQQCGLPLEQLIKNSSAPFVRSALANYLNRVNEEDIPDTMAEAILQRVSEGDDSGLSPRTLQRLREKRFSGLLSELTGNQSKQDLYTSLSGLARHAQRLENGVFSIDFGRFTVVDNPSWEHAYAYSPAVYRELYTAWEQNDYNPAFWPGVPAEELTPARDYMLSARRGRAIMLEFSGFDALYARDLLTNGR